MARKPKYKEGMVVHPSLGEKVADVIIGIILLACMALAITPGTQRSLMEMGNSGRKTKLGRIY